MFKMLHETNKQVNNVLIPVKENKNFPTNFTNELVSHSHSKYKYRIMKKKNYTKFNKEYIHFVVVARK